MPVSTTANRSLASSAFPIRMSGRDLDRDRAAFGEFDRIGEQIHQHLPQPQRIAQQTIGNRRRDIRRKLQSLGRRAVAERLHQFDDQFPQTERSAAQVEFSRFVFREVENVVQQIQAAAGHSI